MWMVFDSGDVLLRRGLKGGSWAKARRVLQHISLAPVGRSCENESRRCRKKKSKAKYDVTTAYSFHPALRCINMKEGHDVLEMVRRVGTGDLTAKTGRAEKIFFFFWRIDLAKDEECDSSPFIPVFSPFPFPSAPAPPKPPLKPTVQDIHRSSANLPPFPPRVPLRVTASVP